MRCQNCGNAVREDAKFCPHCGYDLESGKDEREIYSNSAEKRIDDECRQIENENRRNNFPDDYYTDGYSSVGVDDDKFQTKVYNSVNAGNGSDYAPYAPDDIDEYGNEKSKKHRKLFAVIIICGAIIITAAVVFSALMLGKICSSGSVTEPTQATELTEPTAPSVVAADQIEVSDVVGETQETAISILEQQGFKVSVIKQNSDTVESGCVIDQNPKQGEMAEKGITVTISVSIGTEVSTQTEEQEPTEEVTEAETEPETQEPQTEKTISTYILPESNTRYLDYDDLADLDGYDLVLARNEIYARHGRLFDSEELQEYFNKCTWYNGTISPADFDDSVLNQYERANVDFILQKEYSSGGNW